MSHTLKSIFSFTLLTVALLILPACSSNQAPILLLNVSLTATPAVPKPTTTESAVVDCARSCQPPAQRAPAPRSLGFAEMWSLIVKYHHKHSSHFTPELVACLFWEESGFRLVEHPRSHAAGYGQVLPSSLRQVNRHYGTAFSRTGLLTSPEESVEASILALELAWTWKRDKVQALFGYAGGRNARAVIRWLVAEPELLKARVPYSFTPQVPPPAVQQQVIRGMRGCSPPGFDPRILFQ